MMLAKPKPEESTEGEGDLDFSAPVPTTVPVSVPTTVVPPVVDTTDDREKELERRLAMLGNDVDDAPADTASDPNTASNSASNSNDVTEKKEEEDNLISFDKVTPVEVVPKEEPKKTEEPVVTKMAAAKPGSKSALLARIMAAQERAKQAQMKQTTTTTKTPMTPSVTGMTHIPEPINVEKEKEKMMKALSGIDVFDNQTQEEAMKSQPPPTLDQLKAPTIAPPSVMAMAPPSIMAPPLTAPPPPAFMAPPNMASSTNDNIVNNTDNMPPPPPSFEIFETQQQKMSAPVVVPPPPAFNTIEQNMLNMPGIVPTAPPPPMEDTHDLLSSNVVPGFFDGMTPVAPPIAAPAPSFDQVMSQQHYQQQQQQQQQHNQEEESMDGFDFDIDGNALTPEERHKMMEEQRAILEQIQKQANENKASEAAVRATAFDSRMSTNQQGHVVPTTTTQHNSTSTNMNAMSRSHTNNDNVATIDEVATAVDIVGFDPAEVEEQKKILEEIQKSVSKTRNSAYVAPSSAAAAAASNTQEQRTVDLGDGKKVALHGQDKTKDAIKDGTAILVQCVNCDNWMQVTQSATLMFCPICSVVSPVLKQDSVFTTEEALQLEEDRKLAERLQEEENGGTAAVSDYPGSRSRNAPGSRSIKTTAGTEEEPSWWDSLLVNIGVSAAPDETLNERSAEVKVSHPPGSSSSTRRAFHGGTEEDSERLGLLGATSQSGSFDRGNPRAARVAESKPLFSCVVDSVSNAATTVGAGITSMAYGEDEEEVHGIDTTSFLAVPNIGDDRAGSGNYNVIPHDE